MERRKFLASSLAASGLAVTAPGSALDAAQGMAQAAGREFYQLRQYHINNGPQRKLCNDFFRNALIPALGRLGIGPVGVFDLSIGPQTPTMYVLMPGRSAETLATVESHLGRDAGYEKAGAAFLNAPAKEPAFDRMESTFLQAFEKWPKLILPAATPTRGPRVFELRIYENATDQDHRRKMEMMQSGEADIFAKNGFEQIFYSETLIGPRLPNLTYMLCFESMAARDKQWAAFRESEDWKTFSKQPQYAFEPIVSRITSLILTPTAYSQI
ncbi:MAG TPA: NIPSNAP family protein [Candidatus Dormibacteraeota bacterium]|nr:NIPSNAP family protein [Candidatus Dormibacteraeota bacterium]